MIVVLVVGRGQLVRAFYFIFGFMNSLRGGIPKLEFFLCSISDLLYKFRRSIFEQSQFLLPSLFLSPAGLSL